MLFNARHWLTPASRLLALLALCAGMGLHNPVVVYAASIMVTTTADELNRDGDCSLREAVRAANTNARVDACRAGSSSSTDVITLRAGTYTLAIGGTAEDDALRGDLDLRGTIAVIGAGAGRSIIDASRLDRVFDVRGGANITISGMTLRNGAPLSDFRGGAIRNEGRLTLRGSTLRESGNEGYGGGIYNSPIAVASISSSLVTRNGGFGGGGVWNAGYMTIAGSTIAGNSGYPFGGGIVSEGTLIIKQRTVIRNNTSSGDGEGFGGGIYNIGALTIAESTIVENESDYGFGIANGGSRILRGAGNVTLTNSTVARNSSLGGGGILDDIPGSAGAGIFNFTDGVLTIRSSTIISNTLISGIGAGLYSDGAATVLNSTITGNNAVPDLFSGQDEPVWGQVFGGGIYNRGTLTLSGSVVRRNSITEDGGGIYNTGNLAVTSSVIADNLASNRAANNDGGGIYNTGTLQVSTTTIRANSAISGEDGANGGGIYNVGAATVSGSAIIGNTARPDNEFVSHRSDGGGISNFGSLSVTNSTIHGNIVVSGAGGGIANTGGTATLANVTVSDNDAGGDGGGIRNTAGTVLLRNTILAANGERDCYGPLTSQGFNLFQNKDSFCPIGGTTTGNQFLVDPLLGPLQNNGGPTLTRALLVGSPAIDAGNPAAPATSETACPTSDQRGRPRPKDGDGNGSSRCDIGAFERQSAVSLATAWGESDIPDAPDPSSEPDPVAIPQDQAPGTP
jgi:CSLREA domain-containing protein